MCTGSLDVKRCPSLIWFCILSFFYAPLSYFISSTYSLSFRERIYILQWKESFPSPDAHRKLFPGKWTWPDLISLLLRRKWIPLWNHHCQRSLGTLIPCSRSMLTGTASPSPQLPLPFSPRVVLKATPGLCSFSPSTLPRNYGFSCVIHIKTKWGSKKDSPSRGQKLSHNFNL